MLTLTGLPPKHTHTHIHGLLALPHAPQASRPKFSERVDKFHHPVLTVQILMAKVDYQL